MKHVTYNIKKTLVIFVLGVTCYMLHATYVSAQQVGLSLDPPIVQAKMKPGKSIIVAYTVVNGGDPTNLQFLIRPFIPQGQRGNISVLPLLEGPIQFHLENADIQIEKPFFFPSKTKKQAVIKISIPEGIPEGDYYYIVLAETTPSFSLAGQSTGIASASIGSPLLISITESGITEIKATVADFSFIPAYTLTIGNKIVRIVDSAKELPLVAAVRNMGRNLIQPEGTITDQIGGNKKQYTLISQNILSNSQRLLKATPNTSSSVKSTIILSPYTVGTHRVTLELSFGENTPIHYKSLEFLALPIRLIVVTLITLVILLTVFIVRFIQKNK